MANTNPFTPEEVAQILEAFFAAVGTRQYIGARYVPIFGRKGEESIIWDNTAPYEPLTIVLYQGNSYTSRQYVPAGVEITNEEFWAETGNYNAQIEQYRQETAEAKAAADAVQSDFETILPKSFFETNNLNVKDYVESFSHDFDVIALNAPTELQTYLNETLAKPNVNSVFVPSGEYTISGTVEIPENKTLVFAGSYKDVGKKTARITTEDNVKMFKLHAGSTLAGGVFDLLDTYNTCVAYIDIHNEGVTNATVRDSRIYGGRETYGNLTQTAVYVEGDNALGDAGAGYLVFANFDLHIENVHYAYHFHRNTAVGTANNVWLTNNFIRGYIRHCTRYIFNDFSSGAYANNNCFFEVDIQAGSLISGEADEPGINLAGQNTVVSGNLWDFGGTHQSVGVLFEETSRQNRVLMPTITVDELYNAGSTTTNINFTETILANVSQKVTINKNEESITDFTYKAFRYGPILYIEGNFKTPQQVLANTTLFTLDTDSLIAPIYATIEDSMGSDATPILIAASGNPKTIINLADINASNKWKHFTAIGMYNTAQNMHP